MPNLLIVQASIYEMPFRPGYFNRVVCIGVIQHTPDPAEAFACLAAAVRPGGTLAIDVYRRLVWWKQLLVTKYWVRPITRRIPAETLYRLCERWVAPWWRVTGWVGKVTGHTKTSLLLLIPDYRGTHPLADDVQKQWSTLDCFDMLSPAYDFPQRAEDVRGWFERAKLVDVEVGPGFNGLYGRGKRSNDR